MIDLHLIGIGTGNPEHLTRAAERAMRAADVILLPRKRADTAELLDLRRALVADGDARVVEFDLPARAGDANYLDSVATWHDGVATAWAAAIVAHLPQGGRLALLVWGDPSLYDSTLRIAERLIAGGMEMRITVVPGITSLQALTAAHVIPLNTLGAPVLLTTGRRLREGGAWPAGADTVAVMLDAGCAFEAIDPAGVTIWWGAYLGMAQEALEVGPLDRVGPVIRARRAALRATHGWIMDIYLLRRAAPPAAT